MRQKAFRLFVCVCLVCALLSGIGSPAFAASDHKPLYKGDQIEYYVIPYVIEKGDTIAHVYWLWGLRFEDYADDIRSLNGVENLDLLYVGAIYLLPTTASNLKTDTYVTVMAHEMKSGETAYDIVTAYGVDYYKSVKRLENYNGGKDLTKIEAGEKLLIPLD